MGSNAAIELVNCDVGKQSDGVVVVFCWTLKGISHISVPHKRIQMPSRFLRKIPVPLSLISLYCYHRHPFSSFHSSFQVPFSLSLSLSLSLSRNLCFLNYGRITISPLIIFWFDFLLCFWVEMLLLWVLGHLIFVLPRLHAMLCWVWKQTLVYCSIAGKRWEK